MPTCYGLSRQRGPARTHQNSLAWLKERTYRADIHTIYREIRVWVDLGSIEDLLDCHRPDGGISSFCLLIRIRSARPY